VKVVILGNGIAGVTAAQNLRKLEPDPGKLVLEIYGREPYDYYARIRLPEVFSSSLGPDDLCLYPLSWYKDRSIDVFKGKQAVAIDRAARRVAFSDGTRADYDKLILALGADCLLPDLPGKDLAGIRAIREYPDADWVRRWIGEGARSMAVVGGGLLGLEAARHLCETRLEKVVVLEIAQRLLPRQVDARGSEYVRRIMEGFGVQCRTGVKVESFNGHASLESLTLGPGEELPIDAAIISMGIKPRIGIAKEAGLMVGRGVVVDEGMRTSDPDIYAIGDNAEFGGIVWGIIPAAMEQVQVATARIMGRDARYVQSLPKSTLKVAGVDLLSVGRVNLDAQEESSYDIVLRENEEKLIYQKFVFKDGRLEGAISLGDKSLQGWCFSKVGKETRKEDIPAFLTS
jgi:nitrite reductase (NADH) large subunit